MAISTWSTAHGERVLVISAVFTSLASVLTMLRIYTRAFIVKQMGWDDWMILVSLVFSWAFFGLFVGEVSYGMGEHAAKLPVPIIIMQMKFFWATIPLYNTSLIATKASILLQYLRVFTMRTMRIACYCLIAFLAIYGTWTILSAWLNCLPVAKFWNDNIPGRCLDRAALWFSNSAIHIFTDLLIIIYPMPVLKSLQLPKRQKIAVMGIFSLGGFVLITTILRLQSLLVISNSQDPTYDNTSAASWSAIECNVAIICACLPGTRALVARLFPRIFPSSRNRNYNYYGTHRSRNVPFGPAATATNIETTVSGRGAHQLEKLASTVNDSSSRVHGKGIKVTTAFFRREEEAEAEEEDGRSRDSSVRHLV